MSQSSKPEDIEHTIRMNISPEYGTYEDHSPGSNNLEVTFPNPDDILSPEPETTPAKQPRKKVQQTKKDTKTQEAPHIQLTPDMLLTNQQTISEPQAPISPTENENHTSSILSLSLSSLALILSSVALWFSLSTQSPAPIQVENTQKAQISGQNSRIIALSAQVERLQASLNTLQAQYIKSLNTVTESVVVEKPQVNIITPQTPIQKEHAASAQKKAIVKSKVTSKPTTTTAPKAAVSKVQYGAWRVVISSYDSKKNALAQQRKQTAKGIQTTITTAIIRGKRWHRVIATGFSSKKKAQLFAQSLKKQGIRDAWIQHRK